MGDTALNTTLEDDPSNQAIVTVLKAVFPKLVGSLTSNVAGMMKGFLNKLALRMESGAGNPEGGNSNQAFLEVTTQTSGIDSSVGDVEVAEGALHVDFKKLLSERMKELGNLVGDAVDKLIEQSMANNGTDV